MIAPGDSAAGRFCWIDLAATDARRAQDFYARLFGWRAHEQAANGGSFSRLELEGADVASLYQLGNAQLQQGVPSHWTPYVRVRSADAAARRAAELGGGVLVQPFDVDGIARIALVVDGVGASFGLWQPLAQGGAAGGRA